MNSNTKKMQYYNRFNAIDTHHSYADEFSTICSLLIDICSDTDLSEMDTKDLLKDIIEEF